MAKVTVVLTGDEAKLLKALDKVVQKERELERAATKTGDASERASDKAGRGIKDVDKKQASLASTFGKSALSAVAGFVTIGAAAAALKKIMSDVEASIVASAASVKGAGDSLQKLVQLSGGDPAKAAASVQAAIALRNFAGSQTLTQAGQDLFDIQSAGFIKDVPLLASLQGIADPVKLALGAATLQSAAGEKETGTLRQILSKGVVAAAPGKGTVGGTITGAAQSAGLFKAIGATDEEALAAIGVLAKTSVTQEVGATKLRSLFVALAGKPEFANLGLAGSIQRLTEFQTIGVKLKPAEILSTLFKETPKEGRKGVRERIQKFTSQLFTPEETIEALSGGVLGGRIEELQGRRKKLSTGEIKDFLGRVEALTAFTDLAEANDLFLSQIELVKEANKGTLITDLIKARDAVPILKQARQAVIAGAQAEAVDRPLGVRRGDVDTLQEATSTLLIARGFSRFKARAAVIAEDVIQFFDEDAAERGARVRIGNELPDINQTLPIAELIEALQSATAKQIIANTKLENATSNLEGGPTKGLPGEDR